MSAVFLSILIVNWNTRERVIRCLDSLPSENPDLSREVIVVDNGSVDGSADALRGRAEIHLMPGAGHTVFRDSL